MYDMHAKPQVAQAQAQAMGQAMGMGMPMGMGMGMGMGIGMGMGMPFSSPNSFYFIGNSISLESRLTSMTDQQVNQINDANITVTGTEIKAMNMGGYLLTIICGSFIIIPIFFMCCDWWKRCVFPAFSIAPSVYNSLGRLLNSPNLRNITLTVVDNTFDANKANILCQLVSQSRLVGFTFVNRAGNYNFNESQNSNFSRNMRPIKQLTNVMSDIRWGTQIAR